MKIDDDRREALRIKMGIKWVVYQIIVFIFF